VIVADLGAVAVLVFVARTRVIDAVQGAVSIPTRSTARASSTKGLVSVLSRRTTWRLEITMPMARSWLTRRGMVTQIVTCSKGQSVVGACRPDFESRLAGSRAGILIPRRDGDVTSQMGHPKRLTESAFGEVSSSSCASSRWI
jgi:hypothetical protein